MAKKSEPQSKKELVKIKFLLSPTGEYKLAYGIGDVAEISLDQAKELVEAKFAEYVK